MSAGADRPRVLLLHGIGGGAAIWGEGGSNTVVTLAAAGYDAQALDLPGYGGAAGTTSISGFAEAVLQASGDAPVVLVGHSMGGMVAQEVAATSPGRVAGLVLLCTSAAFGPPGGSWQAQFVAERLAPLEAGIGMAGMAERLVPGLVAPQAGTDPRRIATEVMSRVPEATYRQALVAIAAFDRREALARIGVPTLVVAAEHDRTAPPEVMRRMADRIPGAEYTCLVDAGHIANVEQPLAFHAVLLDFLTRRFP